jgi:Na+-driven multidrug efflux pump
MGTVLMSFSALVLLASRRQLGALFSSEDSVVTLTSYAVPPLAVSLIGGWAGGGGVWGGWAESESAVGV